jgi:photosystem II stability/assembly factor-like uncharacterized protein
MTAKVFPEFAALLILLSSAGAEAQWWEVETTGLDTNLRAVSVVRSRDKKGLPGSVVWASGLHGVILESADEGKTWKRLHVGGGEELDFRGILAFNARTAYLMSSGEGEKSRIYKTRDGGETWKLQYSDTRREFFLDAIACFSEKQCLALGDPIDGKFLLLETVDGERWNPLPADDMPPALGGEGAFAASNSCLVLSGEKEIFFGTGGPAARVFHSADGGLHWSAVRTPIVEGNPWSGIFSMAAADNRVLALGGNYKQPDYLERVAAYSMDHGKTWQLAAQQPLGYHSAVAHIDDGRWVAVGPTGEDITSDDGVHWSHTDSLNLNAVAILDLWTGWAVGAQGTIARFVHHTDDETLFDHRGPRERPAAPVGPTKLLAADFKWSYSSSFPVSRETASAEARYVRRIELPSRSPCGQGREAGSPRFSSGRDGGGCADGHARLGRGARPRRSRPDPRRNRETSRGIGEAPANLDSPALHRRGKSRHERRLRADATDAS